MSTDNRSAAASHGDLPLLVPHADDEMVRKSVSPEMFEHLKLEAQSRGISVWDAYVEEMEARAALDALGDDEPFLSRAEAKTKWPDKYASRDEQKPF